jgi:hypothetical protein
MNFNDFFYLLKQHGNIRKCIHCEAYQEALAHMSKDANRYLNEEWNSNAIVIKTEVYGFLNCEICPPSEILEKYKEKFDKRIQPDMSDHRSPGTDH